MQTLVMLALALGVSDSLVDTMTVRAPRSLSRLSVAEKEDVVGRSEDLNELIALSPEVVRVQGKGSLYFIKGDDYYGNRQLLRGIPVFSLSHFPGQRIADRGIVPLGAPARIDFHTERLGGLYGGASGSVLSVDPILNTWRAMPRPELRLNFGSMGADFTVGIPVHARKQYYQLTFRNLWKYYVWSYYSFNGFGPAGYSQPSSTVDLQFLGNQRVGRVAVDQLLWISNEAYASSFGISERGSFRVREQAMPWGVASVTLRDSSRDSLWDVTIGGGHQFHAEATPLSQYTVSTVVFRDNVAVSARLPTRFYEWFTLTSRVYGEFVDWNATVYQESGARIASGSMYHDGRAGSVGTQLGLRKSLGLTTVGTDLNGGLFVAGLTPYVDAGIWTSIPLTKVHLEVSTGMVSSQPDIRGLPDSSYASRVFHTYQADLKAHYSPLKNLQLTAGTFGKFKDHAPVKSDNAEVPGWDSDHQAQLWAAGVYAQADWRISPWLRYCGSANRIVTRLEENGTLWAPEWDIPWSSRQSFIISPIRDLLHIFVNGEFSGGMAYRSLIVTEEGIMWGTEVHRGPSACVADLKIEYRNKIDRLERYVSQYDLYVHADNIYFGFIGAGADASMPPHYRVRAGEAFASGMGMVMGVRLHTRL